MKARLVLVLGWLAVVGTVGRAEVEFAGYMRTAQGEMKFVLADPAVRQTSEWLGIGGSFAGHRVMSFEAKTETLTVEKDFTPRQLRLKNAAMVAAPADPTVERETAREKAALAAREAYQQRIAEVSGANMKMLMERQGLLTREREAQRELAGQLRAQLPAGDPRIAAMEERIAKLDERIADGAVQIDRSHRVVLLQQIREHANGNPKGMLQLLTQLRDLDARLTKAGVAVEPADVPTIPIHGRPPPPEAASAK